MSVATTGAAVRPRALALFRWQTVVPGSLAALLAACGGGADSGGSAAAAAPAAESPRRAALADAAWTRIASEGAAFAVSGTQTVRYGNPWYGWTQKAVTGTGACTNAFFGSDPAPGKGKVCEVQGAVTTTSPAPAPTTSTTPVGTWTTVATEGQGFALSSAQTVRYGDPYVAWVTATLSGAAVCNNATFGSDPAPGKGKRCDVLVASTTTTAAPAPAPATSGTWTQVAAEGQGFVVSGTQTVRYGARWVGYVEKSVSGAATCSNAFFGSDPAVGSGKVCEVPGDIASAPAPAPAPAPAGVPLLVAPGTWAVIGSSTAQGVGATPGHAWVDLLRAANAARGVSVVGLGLGGTVTYHGLGISAAVAGKPAPDPARNVDAALAHGAKLVVLNYPSNDVAYGYTPDETVGNHLSMRGSAAAGGAATIALSSQPFRNPPSAAQAASFAETDRRLAEAFGPCFVPIRQALATASDTLNPIYDSGDGQHLNDAGHARVQALVQAAIESGQCVKLAP